jgi:hypothetical protein
MKGVRRVMRQLLTFLVTMGVTVCPAAHAREGNTLQDELRIFTADIATQCNSVKDQLEDFKVNADPLTAYTLKDAVQSLCVCMPAQTLALTGALSPQDLARPVTQAEVLNLFNPAIIDKCAGDQIRAMYGEQCRKRFRKADLDVPKYCACMKTVVREYSDATTAAIAAAASDYLPLAAEAEKTGQPAPPRPAILEAYYQADQGCKGNASDITKP